jgi:hypothetical protein
LAAAGLVLLLAALGAACGGDGDDDGNGGGGSSAPTEEFGMTETELVAAIESVESRIATCMTDAGFEYTPIDPGTFRAAMARLGTAQGLNDEEFVEQYGYGITTLPPTRDFGAGEDNAAIRDALPPADQVAYDRTLLGDNIDSTFLITLDAEDFSSTGGCTRSAIESVFSADQLASTYLNPVDAQVEQDQRMIDARERWSECMREEGYDYPRQEDAEEELAERIRELSEGADPATLTGSAQEELAALQDEERAIAQADLACTEESELEDVEEEVERDITGREPE